MIDHHCHILPGMDDGAKTLAESLEMARLLVAAGFREVCCTPHCIRGSYDTTPEEVCEATTALQGALHGEGIALRLQPGMEYYLDEFFLDLQVLLPLGDSRLLLVEAPGQANAEVVRQGLEKVCAAGLTPLIAHPERSEVFTSRVPSLATLPEGCLLQANIGSFTGLYGSQAQRRAYDLLRAGRYAALGSDGHDARRLPAMLEGWREKLLVNPALRQLAGPAPDNGDRGGSFVRLAWAAG